jgi:hypothetical protein
MTRTKHKLLLPVGVAALATGSAALATNGLAKPRIIDPAGRKIGGKRGDSIEHRVSPQITSLSDSRPLKDRPR